ncbi:hypothetical protein UPYG_G00238620 [Umbra pygmaea]|uniref:Ubiquitin-like domain-containing protein n=1 Tax=Umbra pygmaea TaxID=75934 RepID=A0ABD0X106_UMBPY
MPKIYQLNVIGFKGESMIIDVSNTEEQMKNMTVLQLKRKILEKIPDSTQDIRLIFTNQRLEDWCRLSSYGIQHMSVIRLVMIMAGGWRD